MSWQNRIIGEGTERAADLVANPYNWRVHPKAQQDAIEGALNGVGWVQRVIKNKRTGHVVDGHARVLLALRHGDDTPVPIVYVDLSEDEEKAVLATYDPISAMAAKDAEQLKILFADLEGTDWEGMLQQVHDLDGAEKRREVEKTTQSEAPTVVSKRGDLWLLGDHRVRCGDSADRDDVLTLMSIKPASMVLTDPPYNVVEKGKNFASNVSQSHRDLKDSGWDSGFDPRDFLEVALEFCFFDVTMAVFTSHTLFGPIQAWMADELEFDNVIVWCKPNPMPSLSKRRFAWGTELIAYGTRGKHTFNYPSDGHALNWMEFPAGQGDTDHPTEKPIALLERLLSLCSKPQDTILDPFCGSGSTLIACEALGRACYTQDLEPRWVDATVRRWQAMTGKNAVLNKTGEPFAEVEKSRG